jgi:hypothetical protein
MDYYEDGIFAAKILQLFSDRMVANAAKTTESTRCSRLTGAAGVPGEMWIHTGAPAAH